MVSRKNEVQKKETNLKTDEYVPPDGGWGWVIVFAYIIAGLTAIPVIQNFGLVYKQRLKDLDITSTQLTTIIAMNSSLGQILGIFQGPLLKKFGCRPMAFLGVSFLSIGSLLTGLSQNFTHFMLTHGVITSIGFTYTLTAFGMSMNSYFKKKRSRAAGLFMGFTGIGPVVMPLFVTHSLGTYGVFGTGMLLAGLNLHGLVSASLLQPVERHMAKSTEKEQDVEENSKNNLPQHLPLVDAESTIGIEPMQGFDPSRRKSTEGNFKKRGRSVSESEPDPESANTVTTYFAKASENSDQLGTVDEDGQYRPNMKMYKSENGLNSAMLSPTVQFLYASSETLDSNTFNIPQENRQQDDDESVQKQSSCFGRIWPYLKEQFDLDLLHDPTYISITLGMSIAVIGELMFSLLTPFILNEIGLDLQQTAYFMSTVAIADIISRFASPYLGEWVKLPSRAMYIFALFFLLFSRAGLLFVSGTVALIIMAVVIGAAKGVRSVYWGQVLPDHVPNHKLASAMSIQNLCNGILVFFAGPLSGIIVEINDSYLNIIYFSNLLTALTVLLWTVEYLIKKWNKRRQTTKI